MIYLLLKTSDDFKVEARYAFSQIFRIIGCDCREIFNADDVTSGILIYYGIEKLAVHENIFLIHITDCSYRRQIQNIKNIKLKYARRNRVFPGIDACDAQLPYLFAEESAPGESVMYDDQDSANRLITLDHHIISCGVDLVATVFYLLSLANEELSPRRDSLNRFNQEYSVVGSDIYLEPIVDIYIRLIKYFLSLGAAKIKLALQFRERWPSGHGFALALSHDVDRIQTWTIAKIQRVISQRRKEKKDVIRLPWQLLKTVTTVANWRGNFDFIIQLEKGYHGRSSFFFVVKRQSRSDPKYSMNASRIKKGIKHIKSSGFNIGLHGTIASASDGGLLHQEKRELEAITASAINGLRQHYLCFDISHSPHKIQSSGFLYDSTIGFSEEPGYRCGTGFPYFLFDKDKRGPYEFLEIPLILMDTVLFLESKLYFTAMQAEKIVFKYLKDAYRNNGCLTINWHNNNLSLNDLTGYTQLYEKIMQWVQKHNGWLCSLDDLTEWWMRE